MYRRTGDRASIGSAVARGGRGRPCGTAWLRSHSALTTTTATRHSTRTFGESSRGVLPSSTSRATLHGGRADSGDSASPVGAADGLYRSPVSRLGERHLTHARSAAWFRDTHDGIDQSRYLRSGTVWDTPETPVRTMSTTSSYHVSSLLVGWADPCSGTTPPGCSRISRVCSNRSDGTVVAMASPIVQWRTDLDRNSPPIRLWSWSPLTNVPRPLTVTIDSSSYPW